MDSVRILSIEFKNTVSYDRLRQGTIRNGIEFIIVQAGSKLLVYYPTSTYLSGILGNWRLTFVNILGLYWDHNTQHGLKVTYYSCCCCCCYYYYYYCYYHYYQAKPDLTAPVSNSETFHDPYPEALLTQKRNLDTLSPDSTLKPKLKTWSPKPQIL